MSSPPGPQDNRPFVGLDGAPVRCQMETSFLSILGSASLKEWATQQNEPASPTTGEAATPDERNKRSTARKSSRRPPPPPRPGHKAANTRHGGRSRKRKNHSDEDPRPGQSKDNDGKTTSEGQEEEAEARRRRAESFVPNYSGYNTMDTELDIIRQQLIARKEKESSRHSNTH